MVNVHFATVGTYSKHILQGITRFGAKKLYLYYNDDEISKNTVSGVRDFATESMIEVDPKIIQMYNIEELITTFLTDLKRESELIVIVDRNYPYFLRKLDLKFILNIYCLNR